VLDTNVNLRQLVQFLAEASQLQDFHISFYNQVVESDAQLAEILRVEEQPIHFSLRLPNLYPEVEAQTLPVEHAEAPKVQDNAPPKTSFQLGPTLVSLFERFGIQIDFSQIESLKELRDQLPFGLAWMVQDVSGAAPLIELAVAQFAPLLNLPAADLSRDIQALLLYFNSPDVAQEAQQEQQEQPQAEQRKSTGPNNDDGKSVIKHFATCDHCEAQIQGIRYKCLQCPDYDLCEICEAITPRENIHDDQHVFAKLRKPVACGRFRCEVPRSIFRAARCGENTAPRFPRIEKLETELAALKQQVAELVAKRN